MPLTSTEALAYLDGALGKRDPQIIRPLQSFTWTRDLPQGNKLDRIVDALIVTQLQGVAQGNRNMDGKSWIGRNANDLKGVTVDMGGKAVKVLTAGREASWTSLQLERARQTGNFALDTEQVSVINELFQSEAQTFAYLGDSEIGCAGLANSAEIQTVTGDGLLEADTINVDDVVAALDDYQRQAEENANDVVAPSVMLVSPATYAKLFSTKLNDSNKTSVLEYLRRQSFAYAKNGSFEVYSVRELAGIGGSSKDRAILYTPNSNYLEFNVLPVWREKTYDRGLEFCAAYLWRMAEVLFKHPETVLYVDNI